MTGIFITGVKQRGGRVPQPAYYWVPRHTTGGRADWIIPGSPAPVSDRKDGRLVDNLA